MPITRRRFLTLVLGSLCAPARAAVEYPDVQAGTPLAFPRDEGAHPLFRNEWWYVTGWLRERAGRELGFQVTFFRNRPGVAEDGTSRFAAKQLLFAHAAIADPQLARLRIDQRAAREGFELAQASADRTDARIGDWSLVQDGDRYAARIAAREFALDVALTAQSPPLLQGNAGVSRKGPDVRDASFYYSRPQLAVSGSVTLDARAREVSGIAWLDHEWSSRYLMAGAVGWDWTGINLDDGGALMAFRIRDARGATLWAGGSYRDSQGRSRVFAPEDIAFVPRAHWRSPRTGVLYPTSFRVRVADSAFDLEPLLPDQELDARAGVGVVYWEGAVRVTRASAPSNAAGSGAGRGYLELTGYGEPLRI
jgi:predicted secreted hydrolase